MSNEVVPRVPSDHGGPQRDATAPNDEIGWVRLFDRDFLEPGFTRPGSSPGTYAKLIECCMRNLCSHRLGNPPSATGECPEQAETSGSKTGAQALWFVRWWWSSTAAPGARVASLRQQRGAASKEGFSDTTSINDIAACTTPTTPRESSASGGVIESHQRSSTHIGSHIESRHPGLESRHGTNFAAARP